MELSAANRFWLLLGPAALLGGFVAMVALQFWAGESSRQAAFFGMFVMAASICISFISVLVTVLECWPNVRAMRRTDKLYIAAGSAPVVLLVLVLVLLGLDIARGA